MLIKEKLKHKLDFNLHKQRQKSKIERKKDNLKQESLLHRNIVRDLEKDEQEWDIECKNRNKHFVKIKNNIFIHNRYGGYNNKDDLNLKNSFTSMCQSKTNIYQKIYKLVFTNKEDWNHISFVSSKEKRARLCEMIEQEIIIINSKKFNIDKYKNIIYLILSIRNKTFPDIILKNMFIAKLQNIMFLIKEIDSDDNKIEEVSENKGIYR